MKQRSPTIQDKTSAEQSLCQAMLGLESASDIRAFLRDLCTPAELEALVDRWRVVPFLLDGMPYREIHENTGVSITTIGRVARFLHDGHGGYQQATQSLYQAKKGKR